MSILTHGTEFKCSSAVFLGSEGWVKTIVCLASLLSVFPTVQLLIHTEMSSLHETETTVPAGIALHVSVASLSDLHHLSSAAGHTDNWTKRVWSSWIPDMNCPQKYLNT